MSKIDDLSKDIDARINRVSTSLTYGGQLSDLSQKLTWVADAIDAYRAEVAKEIEGLKGDVKSAESAYEREKVRADGLAQEQDRWTNEQLPGWRKRVSETEDKLLRMTMSKDEWRVDSQAKEANEVNLRGQIAFLKQWVQDLQAKQKVQVTSTLTHDYLDRLVSEEPPILGVDPGAPEGDKTVIVWTCCNVAHTYTPPKGCAWEHEADCHECGSKTIIRA